MARKRRETKAEREALCRVVPAIVARHNEILDMPKPVHVSKHIELYYKKIERRISSLVRDKLFELSL